MKKSLLLLITILLVASGVNDAFGKRKKKKSITNKEVALDIPLSGAEFQTDENFWRAVQSGSSNDFSMAQKIAEQNCRQQLATSIQADIKSVVETYCRDLKNVGRNEVAQMYEELTRTVIKQQLTGITQAGQEAFRQQDGQIRFHICLQLSKKHMEEKIMNKLEEEQDLRLEFDRERFKKVFDEELAKFGDEQK